MATPCYLSLSSNGGILTSIEDIIPSIIRVLFGQPGNTSDCVEYYKKSFRVLDARYGKTPQYMADAVSESLMEIYNRYFPNDNINVVCEPEIISEARYNLNISVIVPGYNGQLINLISRRKVSINRETHEFKIEYGNNANADIQSELDRLEEDIVNG